MWISVCFRSAIPGPQGPSPWTQRQIPSITKARPGHHMASGCIGKKPVHFAAPALHMLQAKQCRWCANCVGFWTCVCVMCICLASVTGWPKCQSIRIELQDRVIPVCDVCVCMLVYVCPCGDQRRLGLKSGDIIWKPNNEVSQCREFGK